MFYSKSTGGFYSADVHGPRKLVVADPSWVAPEVDGVPDLEAMPPTIEIENPHCLIPADAIEITEQEHYALIAGQSTGKVITADANGAPVLTDPAPVPLSVLIDAAKAKVRAMRVTAFSSLAGIQSEALANGDTKTAKSICGLQDQLRTITDIDLSACKTADDIDAAFASAWLVIAASAPPAVASAFNGVQP